MASIVNTHHLTTIIIFSWIEKSAPLFCKVININGPKWKTTIVQRAQAQNDSRHHISLQNAKRKETEKNQAPLHIPKVVPPILDASGIPRRDTLFLLALLGTTSCCQQLNVLSTVASLKRPTSILNILRKKLSETITFHSINMFPIFFHYQSLFHCQSSQHLSIHFLSSQSLTAHSVSIPSYSFLI